MRTPVMSALLVLLAGCSSQPTTQDAPASGAAPVPPPPPAEVIVAAPEPSATQSGAKTGGKIPSGYRRETRKGKELYCRQVTTLGTRFPQKMCFTREQLEEIQRRTDSAMNDLEKGIKICGSAETCGGMTPINDRGGARVVQ
jgi:hypothetical protein